MDSVISIFRYFQLLLILIEDIVQSIFKKNQFTMKIEPLTSIWMFVCVMNYCQSAEYVKYVKIFSDYYWLIFIPTEDLGDHFLLILCLLKILATHS